MMKNILAMILITTMLLTLSGCGSSSSKESTTTAPKVVHILQPADVAQYVEKFKQDQAELAFQIQGELFEISLEDFFMKENIIAARYEKGYILIGFNFNENEAVSFLRVFESNLAFEQALENPMRLLDGQTIEVAEENGNYVYSGTVADTSTGDVLNVRLVFNESLISGGSSTIVVEKTKAMLNGDLGTNTYVQITDLINNHPEVDTLVLQQISGSLNDEINMHTGRLVRNAQLTTLVEATSAIYSGGVDLYASGAKRVYIGGAKVGVHSWCCVDGVTADKLGRDHSAHGAQLTYFREMLGTELGPEFYFFTIEAAPFDGAHEMTKAELDKYLLE